jgi:hypothetical protein
MLRREVVAEEVGWEEDWPGGEDVINAMQGIIEWG